MNDTTYRFDAVVETEGCELTILMPCLNEAETLATCISKARSFLARAGIRGEILIADNGSTDGSQAIATSNAARVVTVPSRGYGSALRTGIRAARGRYIIMGDCDDSYDFSRLDQFVEKLRDGYQLVMGNRFKGGILPGAMPPLHRYLGNPVLTGVGRLFFRSDCGDFHCGLRGFERSAILGLDLQSLGMEFASEMVVKSTIHQLRMTEVPTTLSPDGRSRAPHLRSWRDGWRHLRFLLLFSPKWLFLYPGAALTVLGAVLTVWLLPQRRMFAGTTLDIHTLFYTALAVVIGVHSMLFWVLGKLYGMREGIVAPDPKFLRIVGRATLERCIISGGILILAGLVLGVAATTSWSNADFGTLDAAQTMRLVIPSGMSIMIGLHIIYGAFFLNLLQIQATAAK
jgi:glycosyltransferase involved in cell wall biosynthesis